MITRMEICNFVNKIKVINKYGDKLCRGLSIIRNR